MEENPLIDMKQVFVSRIPIRWGDMDAMGHVNNTIFFRYLEQARIEWYGNLGRSGKAGVETSVVHCWCTYHRPLYYPGELEIRTYAGHPGRSSFRIVQEIRRVDDPDTVYATGGSTVVWMDALTGKAVPLPHKMLELMAPEKNGGEE